MNVDLRRLDEAQLEAAARHYEERGYIVVQGLDEVVVGQFRPMVAELIGVDGTELERILEPDSPAEILPKEVRERLARIRTTPALAGALLERLEPLLLRLIGPLVHVSSTFHGQFKGGAVKAVDHGGYGSDFLEVQGPFLLHQDFTGASIPTSPSGLTLWVGLNTSRDWGLRLYPGSHRRGMFCHQWLGLDDERLGRLGEPVELPARAGTAIMFNAMMLHGTGRSGPARRVSCDIRFFPLCGFLPSEVHLLSPDPVSALRAGLERAPGPVLQAPLLEDRTFLGEGHHLENVPAHSVLNWSNYVTHLVRGEPDHALPHLERFVNPEFEPDAIGTYVTKFHNRPLEENNLRAVRARLGRPAPNGAGDRFTMAGSAPP